jgi:PIN domain nuclease of toxin-antitoxin system
MNLLLDTHVFLWYISGDANLSTRHRNAIQDPNNRIFLSVVSIWEAVIKYQLGKLPLPHPPSIYMPAQRIAHKIDSLSVGEDELAQLASLPLLHRDPFDRLLIAQALHGALTVVTVDPDVMAYAVSTLPLA